MEKLLIYDCETLQLTTDFTDFRTMGVAVVGTWRNFDHAYGEDIESFVYEAFCNKENDKDIKDKPQFKKLQFFADKADKIVSFNGIAFDDPLLKEFKLQVNTTFDLLRKVRVSSGQPPDYVKGQSRKGYSLDALAKKNLRSSKTLDGKQAPLLWAGGEHEAVIAYCLTDVALLKKLYSLYVKGELLDPNSGEKLKPV